MKRIKVVQQEVEDKEEMLTDEEYKRQLFELLKSMDWKLWEMLQILQRQERKQVDLEEGKETDLKDIFDTTK